MTTPANSHFFENAEFWRRASQPVRLRKMEMSVDLNCISAVTDGYLAYRNQFEGARGTDTIANCGSPSINISATTINCFFNSLPT